MIHKWQVVDTLLGSRIVDALVATLYNQVSDFPKTHRNYLAAIKKLREELDEESHHYVRKLVAAIDMKCSAQLFYFGIQGLIMNYKHFINPIAPDCTWPQVDFDDFLRVGIAYRMPMYAVRKSTYANLKHSREKDTIICGRQFYHTKQH